MENRYPRLEINLAHLQHNVSRIVEKCGSCGIQVAGVIKGATGHPEVAKAFDKGGAAFIASSRLEQIEDAIDAGIEKPKMLIRVPMLSEVSDVVRLTDISLNSEFEVIKALNEEARRQGKLHKVILMADLGDLREGFWDKEEMVEIAEYIENRMINIQLVGIGTNLGCYGSIAPTAEKLEELVELAEKIEARLDRELEYISGGATSSLMRVWDKDIPERVNLLESEREYCWPETSTHSTVTICRNSIRMFQAESRSHRSKDQTVVSCGNHSHRRFRAHSRLCRQRDEKKSAAGCGQGGLRRSLRAHTYGRGNRGLRSLQRSYHNRCRGRRERL